MKKYVINVDWFDCYVTGQFIEKNQYNVEAQKMTGGAQPEYQLDEFRFVRENIGGRQFEEKYKVFCNEIEFGKILCNPRQPEIMGADTIKIEVLNNVLYECGWVDRLIRLLECTGWQMRNVSRVDIALDGTGFFDTYKQLAVGDIRNKGKALFQSVHDSNLQYRGWRIGKGQKVGTCYYKKEELARSNKEYIRDCWRRSGLNIEENIERFELRLRNEAIKRIVDFDFELLGDSQYLASIMRSQLENFCDFIEGGQDTNKSRAERVEWIDWDSVGGVLLPMETTKRSNETWSMKLACKQMFLIYCSTKVQYYADTAREMAMNINALEWYYSKFPDWQVEHSKRSKNDYKFLTQWAVLQEKQVGILHDKTKVILV